MRTRQIATKLWALWFLGALALLLPAPEAEARLGVAYQAALGSPDSAITDVASRTKYLIERTQYVMSYNDDTHQANWVGWSYSLSDDGTQARTDAWATEELLPSGFLKVGTAAFGTQLGESWDRGHMCPSADRTLNYTDNAVTFRMSNMVPQASNNNQGLWAQFETYCRGLAADGDEVIIMSGPANFTGSRLSNQMSVPGAVWKIVVEIPNATSATPANQRVTTAARVIAILTPNVNSGLGTWQSYITSVEAIEEATGMNFFSLVDPSVASYLKNLVDTGSGPNSPTVLTSFSPSLGPVGTTVTISGYNFGASPTVQFAGASAVAATIVNSNTITATVPVGATSGTISVTGSGGTDVSHTSFTVSGSSPVLSVAVPAMSGLTASEGSAGSSQAYAVTGTYLTGPVTVTAPTNFEVSTDAFAYASQLTLAPAANGSLGAQVYVRIKAGAPVGAVSGVITHSGGGAATQNVNVTGTVTSIQPYLTLSTNSIAGLSALVSFPGTARSYVLNGGNLTNAILVAASTGLEVSTNNSNFSTNVLLSPVSGALASIPLYVRLAAAAAAGSVIGTVEHSGGGASTQTLSVSGSVISQGGGTPARIAAWDFTGESNVATSVAEVFSASLDANNTLTRGPGAAASAGNNSFRTVGFKNDGISETNTDYFQFAFSAQPGQSLSMDSITARFAGTSTFYTTTGATNQFAYSTNGTNFVLIGTPAVITNSASAMTVDLTGISALQSVDPGVTVTFRFFASGQTTTGGWGFHSSAAGTYGLDVTARLSALAPPAPVIAVSGPASAIAHEAFSYQIVASNSPTSYAATGLPEGLTIEPSSGLISGTPTTVGSYAVTLFASSASGEGSASLTINVARNPASPSITSALTATGQVGVAFNYQITASNSPTAYVAGNLPAGLAIDTATGHITGIPTAAGTTSVSVTALNAVGSDTKTLSLTILNPTVTTSTPDLAGFASDFGFTSTSQIYSLSGSDLSSAITVTAPPGFEISSDNTAFSGELLFSPNASGAIEGVLIYVRIAAGATIGEQSGTITHTGSGATPKYVAVSGNVSSASPSLSLTPAALSGFTTKAGTASSTQTYSLSGASLGGLITATAPSGFELSADGVTFSRSLSFTPLNGALTARDITVRLSATASAGTYSGNITHTGGGATQVDVSLAGTVTAVSGPPITSTRSGSAYSGGSFSYTIVAGGALPITGYGASNLPTGLTVNSSTGLISGTVPTVASGTTYTFAISATNSDGPTTAAYTLRVLTSAEQSAIPLNVAVNKYQNATNDTVELLVIGDANGDPPIDMRGMVLKDFTSNMGADLGGKYVFKDVPLWASVKAGTLVVLSAGSSATEDIDGSDFVLRVNLGNANYFEEASGGFDILTTDMVMIKAAGTGVDGVAGGIHALAAGNSSTQYSAFTGRKIRSSNALSTTSNFAYVLNNNARASDFYLSSGASRTSGLTFGSGSTLGNTTYITTLRVLDQTPPVITLNGANPMTVNLGEAFADPGATALDSRDGVRSVSATGSVDTSTAGTYTVTYSSSDSAGNTATATRSVVVQGFAPTLATFAANNVTASTATLNGSVSNAGTSPVSVRGFVYSATETLPVLGGADVLSALAGAGTGAFESVVSSLIPGTTYHFRSYALNTEGLSYGPALAFTTAKAEPQIPVTGFALHSVSTNGIAVAWTGTVADGYLLVVSIGTPAAPSDGTTVLDDTDVSDGSGAINLSSALFFYSGFTGFVPGTNYNFAIWPYNNSGSTVDYKTGSAPTLAAAVLPAPPAAPTFDAVSSDGFTIQWNAVAGATSYLLDISLSPVFDTKLPGYDALPVPGTSLVVSGLTSGTPYYTRVRAVGLSGTGSDSLVANQTTSTADTSAPLIVLNGASPMRLPLGAPFTDPGATATDDIDGSVTVSASGSVDTGATGTYAITYSAADAAGNRSSTVRSVMVLPRATYALEDEYGLMGADAAFSADPDGDGANNLLEYAWGSDPTLPEAPALVPVTMLVGGRLHASAILRDDPAIGITPKACTHLGSWSPDGITELQGVSQDGVPGGFVRRIWSVAPTGSQGFFRLEILGP